VTCGPQLLLPSHFQEDLLAGRNLDEILHEHTGIESLGSKQGALGIFTQGLVTREDIFLQMVKLLWGQYNYYSACLLRK
jgi:non-canonical (house-cleaning) NTP pyrophosphatase